MTLSGLKSHSLLIGSITIAILVIGVILAVLLIPESQDIRQDAATPDGTIRLQMTPEDVSLEPGGEKSTVAVSLNSEGREFSVIRLTIKYPITDPDNPPIIASSPRAAGATSGSNWNCTFNNTPGVSGNEYQIIMQQCSYRGSGSETTFSTNTFTEIMRFDIEAAPNATEQAIALTFDEADSRVSGRITESQIGDIAAIPTSSVQVSISGNPQGEAPSETSDKVSFDLNPTPLSLTAGETKTVTLRLNTQNTDINGFATVLHYPIPTNASATNPPIIASNPRLFGLPTDKQAWTCDPKFNDPEVVAGSYRISLACYTTNNTQLISSTQPSDIFAIDLRAAPTASSQTINLAFVPEDTQATSWIVDTSVNVAAPPTSQLPITIQAASTTSNATPTPTPTPTPAASSGNSCNTTCVATRDCKTGLSCISGTCRDARCSSDETCQCNDLDVAGQTGDTELPESGFDQTLAFSILGIIFLLGGGQLLLLTRSKIKNQEF